MAGALYVVFAVDTEGPAVDPKHPDLLRDWPEVDRFLAKIFERSYRAQVLDSDGRGLVFSWFVLTWTGFTSNPVSRDFGHHRIYDHYTARWGDKIREFGDGIYWHYHHPAPSGIGNAWCRDWSANEEYYNILNRLVIDRGYFPPVFRAGGTIETNETSRWLERWIPFDYSNRSGALNWDVRDANGVCVRDICDWSRAPSDWSLYGPSLEDYQKPGTMRRKIVRCLDLLTGAYALRETDIAEAFARAEQGHDTILATFDHDYRDRADVFVERFLRPLQRVAARYPSVRWRYANALKAVQSVLGYPHTTGPALTIRHEAGLGAFVITSDRPIFGPCPYVASKDLETGEYVREEVKLCAERTWLLPVGDPARARMIGVGSSDAFGNVAMRVCRWKGSRLDESNGLVGPRTT